MIVITGASRGIGYYLMQKLLSEDKEVVGIYNTTSPSSNKDLMYKVDITVPEQINKFVTELRPCIKKIILINCAGINYDSFAHKADPQKWANVINVNLVGTSCSASLTGNAEPDCTASQDFFLHSHLDHPDDIIRPDIHIRCSGATRCALQTLITEAQIFSALLFGSL